MPVIELRDGWTDVNEGLQRGIQTFVQMSALGMQRERNDLANKIAQQNLDWNTEDRARQSGQRQAATEFALAQMDGFSSPTDINTAYAAEGRDELMQSGAAQQGAQGVATRMAAGMMGGGSAPTEWLGSMSGVSFETPVAMKQAAARRARLADVISRLDPEAQRLAQAHFDQELAQSTGAAMKADVSSHLRATLRRGKMPGHEEVLQNLIAAVDKWDPATGQGGLSPTEAEKQFIDIRREWNDDQKDMKVTESGVRALHAMAASGGVAEDPTVTAALQGYSSGEITRKDANAAILRVMPGGSEVMSEYDRLRLDKAREAAKTVPLPTGADFYDSSGVSKGGLESEMTGDQSIDLHSAAQRAYLSDPSVGERFRDKPDWSSPEAQSGVAAWEARLKRQWGWKGGAPKVNEPGTPAPEPELKREDLEKMTDAEIDALLAKRGFAPLPTVEGEDAVTAAATKKKEDRAARKRLGDQEDADVALRDAGYTGELTHDMIQEAVVRAFRRGKEDPEKMAEAQALAMVANAWAETRAGE